MLAQGDNIKGIQQDLTAAAKGAGYCYKPKKWATAANGPAKGPANGPDYYCTWLLLQKNLTTTAVMGPGYCYNR